MHRSLFCFLMATLALLTCRTAFAQKTKTNWSDSIDCYNKKGEYSKSALFAEKWSDFQRKEKGENSAEFGTALQSLGDALRKSGNTKDAETVLNHCLEIRKKLFGEIHLDISTTYYSLGHVKNKMGLYADAEIFYLQALEIKERLLGHFHPDVALVLYSMANLNTRSGNFDRSETLYFQSIEINKKCGQKDSLSLADAYNGLGALYSEMGKYQDAEANFLNAIQIWTKEKGEDHAGLAYPYNNLGFLNEKIGNYSKAKTFYLKSLAISIKTFGENHIDVADAYNNLGVLSLEMQYYKEAEEYLLKSLAIKTNFLEESDIEMGVTYLNLGSFYYLISNYPKAEIRFHEALKIYKKLLGETHIDVAKLYNNLASVNMRMGNYKEAENFFLKSLELYKKAMGESFSEVEMSNSRLGLLNTILGNYEKAEKFYLNFENIQQRLLKRYFPFLNDAEKEKYVEKERSYMAIFKAFCVKRYPTNPRIAAQLFDHQLATKGILLHSSAKWRQRIKTASDAEVKEQFETWTNYQSKLNQLYQSSDSAERFGIDSIQLKTEKIEKVLSVRSENFAKLADRNSIGWKDIQKKLKAGEAAVEILRIHKFGIEESITDTNDPKKPTYKVYGVSDTIVYAALILKPKSKYPELITLENGNELESKYLKNYQKSISKRVQDLVSYEQFWKKIDAKLKGVHVVYFSPDGVYHKINLNTIQNPATKKHLLDEKDIRVLTSTKDLLDNNNIQEKGLKACLIGFPNFYRFDSSDSINKMGKAELTNNKGVWSDWSGKLEELPETKIEIEKIGQLLGNQSWKVDGLLGSKAKEENIKQLSNPTLLHIATHGFFQSDASKNGNPLLRSGLFLSGAGQTLKGQRSKMEEDGILTSAEAMNLNLDNTELVVLSACETGLGEVKNGEGVYGLQRAFKVAGAKAIVMSLWKVEDQATQELMICFYKNWLNAKTNTKKAGSGPTFQELRNHKREAFLKAQKQLKARYPSPFYWGAFVMVGS